MTRKRILFIILIILLIIVLSIIINKNMTKNKKIGNNINSQKIVDNILNLNSYKAKVKVQVKSNKNENIYIINQEYSSENGCIQEIIEPQNIAGVKIIKKDNNLSIQNSQLNLDKIFNNYTTLEDNNLDLINFINKYKEFSQSKYEEKDNQIIMSTIIENNNPYIEKEKLYINKGNSKPIKLLIQNNNKNTTIIIEYIEIELN